MRYDLILRRAEGATVYLGQADSKSHAREWAQRRLRKTEHPDIHAGDCVAVHPVGDPDPAFVVE